MRSFQLSRNRLANVWLDEGPPADFTAASVVTRLVKPKVTVDPSRRVAGVEICIHHGPRASYALLGAELVDANVDGLEVVVAVNNMGSPFRPSLAILPDEAQVGLLEEYAGAVVAGAVKVAEEVGAPTGAAVKFRWAAHGHIGSSRSIFEMASGIVLQLLMLPEIVSDEQVRALFG
jgi:hypothetical protein